MDPLSLIGGLGSGIAGMFAQEGADETNYNIALMNYYQHQDDMRRQRQMAEQVMHDQKLGATDARGNRTHFIEGVGWVTDMSPQGKTMMDAQDREQMQVLNHDLPAKRAKMDENLQAQIPERQQANALLTMFRNNLIRRPTNDATEGWIRDAETRGINQAADDGLNTAARGAVRSGNSNFGSVVAAVNKSRMDKLAGAFTDAKIKAKDYNAQSFDAKQSGLANLYNTFATRASQMPGVSYQPQNLDNDANNLLRTFSQQAQQGYGDLFSAASAKSPDFEYKAEPNFGLANTLQQAFAGMGSMSKSDQYDDRLRKGDTGLY